MVRSRNSGGEAPTEAAPINSGPVFLPLSAACCIVWALAPLWQLRTSRKDQHRERERHQQETEVTSLCEC